jgi:hypothetical protein
MSATVLRDAGVDHQLQPSITAGPRAATGARSEPPPRLVFTDTLKDALCLLDYATQAGKDVDPVVAQRIIAAGRRGDAAWDDASAGELMSAIAKLGGQMAPVTAETLRASEKQVHDTIRNYRWIAIVLAVLIIPWSVMSFLYAGINTTITNDIAAANQMVVNLHAQLNTSPSGTGEKAQLAPADALPELQQFAATTRSIYRHAHKLALFVPKTSWLLPASDRDQVTESTRFELDTNLSGDISQMRKNLDELTGTYQKVRSYAKYTQDDGAAVYGAVSTCLLPILYAVLGACAFLLRTFSAQLTARTFARSYSTSARFVIAAIAGGVVGLFNNFGPGQAATLSPLAIAFLAGYGVDVFFSLIDGAVSGATKTIKA